MGADVAEIGTVAATRVCTAMVDVGVTCGVTVIALDGATVGINTAAIVGVNTVGDAVASKLSGTVATDRCSITKGNPF